MQIDRYGDWRVAIKAGADGVLVGWAKKGPIAGNCPLTETGEVFFQFGRSVAEITDTLLLEVGVLVA